jgi:AhpD family alkylhydroperoxidase
MSLTLKEKELVAIGASIAGNCIPCLEWHYDKCKELGLSKQELAQAIAVAKKVKEVPNQKIYEVADQLNADHSKKAKGDANSENSACCLS